MQNREKVTNNLSLDCRNKKNYVIIDVQNVFDQPVSHKLIMYDNIWKIITGQGDHYVTGCLLDYNYFKNYFKMIAKYLSKRKVLDAGPKPIQQIKCTGSLAQAKAFFITEEAKKSSFRTLKEFWFYCLFSYKVT